jgi:hypothetical protein
VHAADIQDRDGGELVMATLFGLFPFLLKLYADGGYQGPLFRAAIQKTMKQVDVEIVKRSDAAKGFVVLPRRWVVERTFAWWRAPNSAENMSLIRARQGSTQPGFNRPSNGTQMQKAR